MSAIDIRNAGVETIDKIVFSDEGSNYVIATHLTQGKGEDCFKIVTEDCRESVIVESKEQAQNLIKAIDKAIQLGWVE